MQTVTKVALIGAGAGAAAVVVIWRSPMMRQQASQAFSDARARLRGYTTPDTAKLQSQPAHGAFPQTTGETNQSREVFGEGAPRPASAPSAPRATVAPGSAEVSSARQGSGTQQNSGQQAGGSARQGSGAQPGSAQTAGGNSNVRHGHNAVARSNLDRTIVDAQDLAPRDDPDAGQLEEFGDDRIISDRVRTNLGRELQAEHLERLNVNTQQNGVVYLRGPVETQEQSRDIQRIVEQTEGVQQVINELQIERPV